VETNVIELALYESLGFKQRGFLRDNMLLDGRKLGSFDLSMLISDYQCLQKII